MSASTCNGSDVSAEGTLGFAAKLLRRCGAGEGCARPPVWSSADRRLLCRFAGALASQARDRLGIRRPASPTNSGSAGGVLAPHPLRTRSSAGAARDPLPRIGRHTASRRRVFGPQRVSAGVDGPADGVSPPLRAVRSHAAPVVAIPQFQPSRQFALSHHLGHLFGSGDLQ